ncbi:MAG: SOS response-associated peptidase [Ardenticatenales bacterium]|nr:SOS response-associated peptidase [Ardenticatenales bacterium]
MCGRFTLKVDPNTVYEALELGEMPAKLEPRYNIAPSQPVAVVTDPALRKVEMFRWGLIPSWAKDPSIANKLINARAETVTEKPSFRTAFAKRRCLVIADGFYEWQKRSKAQGGSQPYYFQLDSHDPFAFAGLWELWRDPEGEVVHSCTLITCAANDLVAPVHARMPVILGEESLWQWLEPDASEDTLHTLLQPYPAERMAAYPVSDLVNSPYNDSPECVEPVAA